MSASRSGIALCLVAAWCVAGGRQLEAQVPERPSVGLLPVYNASGEPYGDVFSAFLTISLFDALAKEGWNCLLLNPGGQYSPFDESRAYVHARDAGVDWVVFLTLNPARREHYTDSRPEIVLDGRIVSVEENGAPKPFVVRHEVKRRQLDGGFDMGPYPRMPRGAAASEYSLWYWYEVASSRRLSKQPLGKAVLRTAAEARASMAAAFPAFPRRAAPPLTASACDLEFRVVDRARKWSSKSFTLVVNGRDESATLKDGVVRFKGTPGVTVFELSMKDAPFGLPIQSSYVATAFVGCTEAGFRLDIGSGGEALLVKEAAATR